ADASDLRASARALRFRAACRRSGGRRRSSGRARAPARHPRLSGSRGRARRIKSDRVAPMIIGAHVLFYSTNADADRAFLRDTFAFPSVDVGGGWLIF